MRKCRENKTAGKQQKNEIVMDNDTTTINNDEKECDDIGKKGETTSVSEQDDTDIGQG